MALHEFLKFAIRHDFCAHVERPGDGSRYQHFVGAAPLLSPRRTHNEATRLNSSKFLADAGLDGVRLATGDDLSIGQQPNLDCLRISRARRDRPRERLITDFFNFELVRGGRQVQNHRSRSSRTAINIYGNVIWQCVDRHFADTRRQVHCDRFRSRRN